MIWIYCKTDDHPKVVGGYICKSNFNQGSSDQKSRIIKDDSEEDCFIIEINSHNEASAMIYRIGHEVVVTEIDEDCAVNVIEPLMKKYGFDNVKWLLTK